MSPLTDLIPLECWSTWSSNVTELRLRLPVALVWWLEKEQSVEKLSSSMTSVPEEQNK